MAKQTREATKLYRESHLEEQRAYQKAYNQLPEARAKRRDYKRAHPAKQLLSSARHRARKRGIPFDIIEADITIPERCPILDIPLFVSHGKCGPNSPTLDQVNPGIGYVKDNVCVISHKANTMKQNNTVEDFERFIRYMKGTN